MNDEVNMPAALRGKNCHEHAITCSRKSNPTPHPLPLLKLHVEIPARRRSGRAFWGGPRGCTHPKNRDRRDGCARQDNLCLTADKVCLFLWNHVRHFRRLLRKVAGYERPR